MQNDREIINEAKLLFFASNKGYCLMDIILMMAQIKLNHGGSITTMVIR
jgi:hypothetical protein